MQNQNVNSIYRQELKERILNTATVMFHKHGIKSVKMDDIASHLSISKRTLYEIYANKEDLLFEVVTHHENKTHEQIEKFDGHGKNVIDIIIEFYRTQVAELIDIAPVFFEDLHKYPKLIKYLHDTHDQRRQHSIAFIQRGIKEGYFLNNVNYEITQRIGDAVSNYVMSTYMYKDFPIKELFRSMVLIFLRGICTEKGVKKMDAFLNEY